jgi:lysophospholipase L1-like esterase
MAWLAGLVIAAAVALVVGELGSRWWMRRRSRYHVWPPGWRLELRQDPEVFPEVEPRVRFEINADGERGGDLPRDTAGLFRVLVAGGSAAECFALDQPTSWPGMLEQLLNDAGSLRTLGARRVHVGNIAHSGVGSAELDLILERVLPQYDRLNAILIMVGASDIYHWLEEGAPPHPPAMVPELALFSRHPQQPFGWRPNESALAEVARRVRRSWLRPLEVKEHAGSWVVAARKMRAAAKEERTSLPDPAPVLEHFEHHFVRLIHRAQAHADRVLVLRQPWFENDYTADEAARFWHGGMGKAWKETITVYYSLEVVNELLGLVDARVTKISTALGVQSLTLRPLLTERLRHYYDHDHFTAAGAAVVAGAVAAVMLRPPVTSRPSRGHAVGDSSSAAVAAG